MAKKTLDTNFLNLRTIFAYNPDNTNISSTKILATDGQDGTFWSPPQLLGQLPTFNAFETEAQVIRATNTNRTLRLTASNGVGFTGSTLIGEYFTHFDVSGSSSISTIKNNRTTGTLNIQTSSFISAYTDTNTNTITLSSSKSAPALSTGDLYFQQLKVVSSVQEPCDATGDSIIYGASYDTYPSFVAVSPLTFSTLITTKQVFLSAYPYTAAGFFSLSSYTGSLFISSFSTISTLYVTKTDFSTGMGSVSTIQYLNYSTNMSTVVKLSNDTQIKYLNAAGDTLARAFIVQLTDQFTTLNTGLSTLSTNKTLKSFMFDTNANIFLNNLSYTTSTISTFIGNGFNLELSDFITSRIIVFSTQLSTLSTSMTTNLLLMSNTVNANITTYFLSTASTFAQLPYISSISLISTTKSLPYVSSQVLQSTLTIVPYLSSPSLVSSFSLQNTFTLYTDRSTFTQNLQSTVKGINDNAPYISSLTLQSTLQSTFVFGNYIYNIASTTQGILDYGAFNDYVSSISTFLPQGYASNLDVALYSTTNAIFSQTSTISTLSYISTFAGLGQLYVSTPVPSILGCFRSSIGYDGYSGTSQNCFRIQNLVDNPYYFSFTSYNYDIYFSTAKLRVDTLSTYIVSTSQVQIDFNLCFNFPTTYYSPSSNDRLVPISSFLKYNDTNYVSLRNGTFSEYINLFYDTTFDTTYNNFGRYEKRISFVFSGDEIMKTYSYSNLLLNHRVLFAQALPNPNIFIQLKSFASPKNSIFVSIYN
jgi:hypothetical protein